MHGVLFGQKDVFGAAGEDNRLAVGKLLFEPGNDPSLILQNVAEPDRNQVGLPIWQRTGSQANFCRSQRFRDEVAAACRRLRGD